jgi:hypothetical protein
MMPGRRAASGFVGLVSLLRSMVPATVPIFAECDISRKGMGISASSSALRTPKQNPAVRARMISFVIILPLSYIFFGNYA